MSGYLDAYGVSDARRERTIKWIAGTAIAAVVIGLSGYFYFQNWGEKQRAKEFLRTLTRQDFATAYAMFGCSVEKPCRDFAYEKFLEDWGPQNPVRRADRLSIANTEQCGNGLLVNINAGGRREESLLVDTATKTIIYAPWPECPEPRFRLMKWLRMKFGRQPVQ